MSGDLIEAGRGAYRVGNPAQDDAVARLARVMWRAGWEVEYADIDLTGGRATAEIKVVRTDGRWLLARVDGLGRASITRYHRRTFLGKGRGARGRVPLSPQVEDDFLGRQHFEGARSMLRSLTRYVAGNAVNPVALADIRAGWAAVMGAPLRIPNMGGDGS